MLHISRHFLGNEFTFQPRIPVSQNECESKLAPRICAATSAYQCWEAINGCFDLINEMQNNKTTGYYYFVYEFTNPSQFTPNTCVKDFAATGEHVSFTPATASLIDVFYVAKNMMRNEPLHKAMETATIEEAVGQYKEWQGADLKIIEQKVKNA